MRDYYNRNAKSSFKNIHTLRIRIFLDSSENFKLLFCQEEPSPVSYRTLVYMVVWACMMFWMLTLGFVMITDNTATIGVDLNTSNRRSHTLENLNKFIGEYFFQWFSINIFLWMYLFTHILYFWVYSLLVYHIINFYDTTVVVVYINKMKTTFTSI